MPILAVTPVQSAVLVQVPESSELDHECNIEMDSAVEFSMTICTVMRAIRNWAFQLKT